MNTSNLTYRQQQHNVPKLIKIDPFKQDDEAVNDEEFDNNYVSSIVIEREAPLPTYFSNQRDSKKYKAEKDVKVSFLEDNDSTYWERSSQLDECKFQFQINTMGLMSQRVRWLKQQRGLSFELFANVKSYQQQQQQQQSEYYHFHKNSQESQQFGGRELKVLNDSTQMTNMKSKTSGNILVQCKSCDQSKVPLTDENIRNSQQTTSRSTAIENSIINDQICDDCFRQNKLNSIGSSRRKCKRTRVSIIKLVNKPGISPTNQKVEINQVAKKECFEDPEPKAPISSFCSESTEFNEYVHYYPEDSSIEIVQVTEEDKEPIVNEIEQVISQSEENKLHAILKRNLGQLSPQSEFKKNDRIYDIINQVQIQGSILDRLKKSDGEKDSANVSLTSSQQSISFNQNEAFVKLFKDIKLKLSLRYSSTLQLTAISIIGYIISSDVHALMLDKLRSLAYHVHQNMIVIIQFILDRFNQEQVSQNVWLIKLQKLLSESPISLQLQRSRDRIVMISDNNMIIKTLLDCILQKSFQDRHNIQNKENYDIFMNPIFDASFEVLNKIDFLNFKQCKNIIGKSLRSDFSEIEMKIEQEALNRSNNVQTANDYRVRVDDDLPLVEAPYLKVPVLNKKYTLVLDMDETLIHCHEVSETEVELRVRPGAEEFLKNMSKYYEIIIFTNAQQDYADWALSHLDTKSCIDQRFYRQHAVPLSTEENCQQAFYVKDISRIGRDISKMIIVDNIAENYRLQPENGIFIKTWEEDPYDSALHELGPLLEAIAQSNFSDVRDALRIFRDYMMKQLASGNPNPTQGISQKLKEIFNKQNRILEKENSSGIHHK
ncbi:nli interacting factor-like phosphatase family protein [Stylonychia lemnae]|uniref:Nli interacting factor-like phosphatase family protein n=1 Tax=Stylonychia lemnae TaxID=5949 RepID=A0A078B8Z8_STYLE|nr:nli interacting factor-like phosphatase family protein [Stylonychia lemnae]|eukprot:CDW89752.1 nli interacting factor-like phosphatase family protein [Stylonychia lemnae]